jgi:hypothetical protein
MEIGCNLLGDIMETRYFDTENPIKQTWEYLSLALTKENLEKTFNRQFKKTKIENIRFLFEQAYELFFNSQNLSLKVLPLNQFYCFSLLTKIIILINDRRKNSAKVCNKNMGYL